MSSLRTILQDADPLRHETPLPDARHAALRRRVLETAPADGTATTMPRGLTRRAALMAAAILVGGVGYVFVSKQGTAVLAAVRFEVRLAEDRPTPGLVVAQVENSTRLIYLHPEAVVTNDDIAQSRVVQDGAAFGVEVEFVSSGAERMRQATASHVGRPVAILLDGSVVMAPVVRSPIDGSALVTGGFTRADAERIASGVTR